MARYEGKAAGSFGTLDGVITFDWEPDVEEYVRDLLSIEGYIKDIESPLLLSRQVLHDDIRMRFLHKVDPEGDPWEGWSRSYAKYRALHYPEGGILVRTGDLFDAATNETAYIVHEAGIFFDTGGLPKYWYWTQTGRNAGSTRVSQERIRQEAQFLGVSEDVASISLHARARQAGGKMTNRMPARPFVGASFEAEIKIVEIFDKWFDGAITVGTSSRGKVFGRHSYRGPGGTFARRV